MNWFWWVWIFVMLGGAGGVANTVRSALDNRHRRRMAVIKAKTEAEERHRKALAEADRQPEAICGCGHHLAKHDRAGHCHEMEQRAVEWDANQRPIRFEAAQCTCQQYVGPRPLEAYYAEPLIDLDAQLEKPSLEKKKRDE
ncbi:hypothetical protein BIV57_14610 [Mangrovactinospora gilvigrisea]|uniref:Uncharacterized protein n=1 Tax=Mangrovactinospora gilvigrisea TaxID=1428644 RepID=A0A1J7BDK7_9ACTN|nr:hypothetical protein [Mangrovactinospora gilvigrisea]OIV36763.1 hypothetical protein BIV57_14610 [Mangrovactinospora gilvigrisea]